MESEERCMPARAGLAFVMQGKLLKQWRIRYNIFIVAHTRSNV